MCSMPKSQEWGAFITAEPTQNGSIPFREMQLLFRDSGPKPQATQPKQVKRREF